MGLSEDLACWLGDHGKDDEATPIRVPWPSIGQNLAGPSRAAKLADVARNAKVRVGVARKVERQADETPPV